MPKRKHFGVEWYDRDAVPPVFEAMNAGSGDEVGEIVFCRGKLFVYDFAVNASGYEQYLSDLTATYGPPTRDTSVEYGGG